LSTKIWQAWRFPVGRLREFQEIVRPQMFAEVIKWVELLMPTVTPEAVALRMAKYRKDAGSWSGVFSEADTERSIRAEVVLDLVKQTRDEYGGHMLWLDCGFNVWIDKGKCYVIPWGQPQFYADLTVPEWAEDYHYQNSTDRPDDIDEKAWEARARTWDRVALRDWSAHRLAFRVIDMSTDGHGRTDIWFHVLTEAKKNRAAELVAST
jgi:hypothetical protein